ncbi:MAG: helix-turn-helix domain-containing protein [Bacteroidales bacterium]|jgi:energy-coupling factor transporter ATP-binding protein EcfA2|nr:helix-turn-helix domain-containing protein [Bacteroidales bacterium]
MNDNIRYQDENNAVFEMATTFVNETQEHIFLTGKAGTGKTTFLRHIRRQTHKMAVVAAPTGVAAINAEGVTLHSLFQLPLEPYIPGYPAQKNMFRFGKAKLDLLRQLELLIIDEVSMLRADTLDAIDNTLQRMRHSTEPFGGVQVLYIGDMFQLPPVVKDDEWALLNPYYESIFFFHAHVVKRMPPIYLELKKVYRQSEQAFIDLLNHVRNNCLSEADFHRLNERYQPHFKPAPEEKYITLTTHNYKAAHINKEELDKLPDKEYTFQGVIEGEFPEYALPADRQLRLKKGAQVMFIRNDPNGRYFNGKIATVSDVADNRIEVRIGDEHLEVQKETWKNVKYTLNKLTSKMEEEETGTYMQYPLRLAWAITIHKSQGLTFDRAIIDIGASFAAGQTYVALSRCTALEGIALLTKVSPTCILTDTHAVAFAKTEKNGGELQQILVDGRRKFWRKRLLLYFEWKPIFTFLQEFNKLLEDKVSDEFEPMRQLLRDFRKTATEMNGVTAKFCRQLSELTVHAETTGDIQPLSDRCRKAVAYFHSHTVERILLPLQARIEQFQFARRARTFHKNIIELEKDVVLFLENMKRVRYNNVPLVEGLELTVPVRKNIFTPFASTNGNVTDKPGKEKTTDQPAPDTHRVTMEMFNSGLSIQAIAEQRHLQVSTIEGHLAKFIGKEVPAEKIFTPDELEALSTLLQPLLSMEKPEYKPLYEQAAGKYSYGKLRMAFQYFKSLTQQY